MPTLKNILVKKMISDVELCYFETFRANASKFNMVLLYKEPSRIPEIVEMTDIKPEDIKEQLKASNSNITFAGGLPLTWMKEVRVRRSITATQPLHFDHEDSEQSASLTREKRVADTEESQGEISSTITQLEAENVAKSRLELLVKISSNSANSESEVRERKQKSSSQQTDEKVEESQGQRDSPSSPRVSTVADPGSASGQPETQKSQVTKCPQCRQDFKKEKEFNIHMKCLHSFKCDFCPLKFTFANGLNDHINREHQELLGRSKRRKASKIPFFSPSLTRQQQEVSQEKKRKTKNMNNPTGPKTEPCDQNPWSSQAPTLQGDRGGREQMEDTSPCEATESMIRLLKNHAKICQVRCTRKH